jgi:hypothetical protein
MQWRILFSSLVDKIEHTEAFELVEEEVANPEDKVPEEAGMNGVVDETVDELWLFEELFGDKALVPVGDPPPPDLFFVLVGSPSAKTHDRFMPAFSQA